MAARKSVKRRARKRDYAKEYKQRLKRALDKGYSRSIARGHPKKTEISLARAKRLKIVAGLGIIRPQSRPGYRPTKREIINRIRRLGLPLSESIIRAKWKGRMPNQWKGPPGDRYLVDHAGRNGFVEFYVDQGLSEREAYTLWFSP
jgi:hypothetical protein